jgi:peptide/nickel transport system substrate-binding protein
MARTGATARRKYGGTLVVGLTAGDPATLDPTFGGGSGIEVYPLLLERLYVFDAKSEIVPQLASALPAISKDKLTYTIQIRLGIDFNDETPLNAAAVVTSLERMISFPGSANASNLDSVDTVAPTGQYTVVIHLKERFTPLTSPQARCQGMSSKAAM